jgi:hypothetical protein
MSEPTSASQFGPPKESPPPSPGVVLAATFTTDPLVDSLSLLLREARKNVEADILLSYLADLGSYPASVSADGGRAA